MSSPSIEKMVFVGWIELILFICFFFSSIAKKLKAFFFVLVSIPIILSLGYPESSYAVLLPYRFLQDIFPFSLLVEPGRFVVIFAFFMTIASMLFLATLREKKYALGMFLLLIFLTTLERVPVSYKHTTAYTQEAYLPVVQAESSQAVLDLPINLTAPRYNVMSLLYDKASVNGYFHWSADTQKEKSFVNQEILKRFVCDEQDPINAYGLDEIKETRLNDELFSTLQEHGITTIVVHTDDKYYHLVCQNVRRRLNHLIPAIKELQLTTDSKPKHLIGQVVTGKGSLSFYFPYTGTLHLDSIYLAPSRPTSFILQGENVPTEYVFTPIPNTNTYEMQPKFVLQIPVTAGQTIEIAAPGVFDLLYYDIQYRYFPVTNAVEIPQTNTFTQLFEDENTQVYRLQ